MRSENGIPGGKAEIIRLGETNGIVITTDIPRAYGTLQSTDSLRVATGQIGYPGGRALRPHRVDVGELDALARDAVDVRRF